MNDKWARSAFAAYLVLVIAPLAAGMVYAAAYSVGLAGLLRTGLSLAAWRAIINSGELFSALLLSAWVALAVTGLSTASGLVLALTLRGPIVHGSLGGLLHLPLALPTTVVAFATYQLLSGGGWLARIARALGTGAGDGAFPELVQDRWGIGIIAAHTLLAAPLLAIVFAQLYQAKRVDELAALARSLGASRGQIVRRVELPLLLRAARTNLFLLLVVVFGSYEIALALGRQSPQMLSVMTMRKFAMFDLNEKPQAYALALLYTLLMLAVLIAVLGRAEKRDAA